MGIRSNRLATPYVALQPELSQNKLLKFTFILFWRDNILWILRSIYMALCLRDPISCLSEKTLSIISLEIPRDEVSIPKPHYRIYKTMDSIINEYKEKLEDTEKLNKELLEKLYINDATTTTSAATASTAAATMTTTTAVVAATTTTTTTVATFIHECPNCYYVFSHKRYKNVNNNNNNNNNNNTNKCLNGNDEDGNYVSNRNNNISVLFSRLNGYDINDPSNNIINNNNNSTIINNNDNNNKLPNLCFRSIYLTRKAIKEISVYI
ncbi:hypothetical protein HELRODRAFT_168722 [Helobdella robusta]|uniref:Uncharacterized protein n=1 Tax=Helobdella robusta TaxID=6412 RepID=T1F0W3_HELRO|nr:hypothetical protein HELRODRAFT_168722 [Helobdella robusta]ESO08813.1 hypothetical protein HELRODRAFT_168722 [Helobdella robusta]